MISFLSYFLIVDPHLGRLVKPLNVSFVFLMLSVSPVNCSLRGVVYRAGFAAYSDRTDGGLYSH